MEENIINLTHEEKCFLNNELVAKKNHIMDFLLDYSQGKNAIYNSIFERDEKWGRQAIENMKRDLLLCIDIQKKLFPDWQDDSDETFLEFVKNLK